MANAKNYRFEFLKTRLEGHTLVLSFNRPKVLNAINSDMESQLYEALRRAEADETVKVVLLKGEGRIFSAGHDIRQVAREMFDGAPSPTINGKNWMRTGEMLPPWYFTKPLVAAVHGYVGPHALAILLTCDYLMAARKTRFSFEAAQKMSTGLPYGPYCLLPFYFPPRAMKKIWLSGGWFSAEQARALHFVQRVVAPAKLEAEALRFCRYLERLPHKNQRDNKKGIHQLYEIWGLAQMMVLGRERYEGGPEEQATLAAHFQVAHNKGVGAAADQRDEGVDPKVSQI